MTRDPHATDGVVSRASNSLLEVALPVDTPPGIRKVGSGQQLAQARAAVGLSVEALAARLRLSTAQVIALDAEQWDQLPDKSFVRAALRAYATQIQVDVTPLVEHVGGFGEPSVLEPTASVDSVAKGAAGFRFGRASDPGRRGWLNQLLAYRWPMLGVGGVLLLGLVLALIGSLSQSPSVSRVQSVPIPGAMLAPGSTDNTGVRPAINSAGATGLSGGGQSGQQVGGAASAREATPSIGTGGSIIRLSPDPVTIRDAVSTGERQPTARKADVETAVPPGDGRVRVAGAVTVFPVQMPDSEPVHVHFKKRAWIDITHKDGVKLLSGTQDANQSFKLDGTPPMRVQIGNPGGVAIEFRGQLIDLKSKTNDKGVAKFTLN